MATQEKAKAMVLASFIGDSLALGVHWIYNTNVIDRKIGRITGLLKPIVNSWHPNRDKGEFTHYGDQAMVLLETIAVSSEFDLNLFFQNWQTLFTDYNGYMDKATKVTLENIQSGKGPDESGSESTDFSGAARIAPLVFRYFNDPKALDAAVRAQAAMTHNHPHVVESAAFLGHICSAVLGGLSPVKALTSAIQGPFNKEPFLSWIQKGLDSVEKESRAVISEFGQMCEINAALPSTIHLIGRYENNLKEAMIENCMAGGDSAARGLVLGMILGAWLGMDAIPVEWLADLKGRERIEALLNRITMSSD